MIVLRALPPADRTWALPQILALIEQERHRVEHLNFQEPDFYSRFFEGEGVPIGAWEGERLVGFALLGFSPFLGKLWPPYVERMNLDPSTCCTATHILLDSSSRHRGLGLRLTRRQCQVAWSLGFRTIFASTHPDNHTSVKLLRAAGFVSLEVRRVYEAQVLRMLLACQLSGPPRPASAPVLAYLPTPLEPLPHLSRALGGPEIWIKRDDMTGLAAGGNKARMLELFLEDALGRGARTLVTRGSSVSNHCRQTAAAAARHGLDCVLVIRGPEPPMLSGNLYLCRLMGARLVWTAGGDPDEVLQGVLEDLEVQGRAPYAICYGGASALGAAAYSEAVLELKLQHERPFDHMVVATSSGATQAGLVAGCMLHGYPSKVLGISVDEPSAPTRAGVAGLVRQVAGLDGNPPLPDPSGLISVCDAHIGPGYAAVTDLERGAVRLLAEREGILVDPVYTGRALGGLIERIKQGQYSSSERVLFWHTGGLPSLFAMTEEILGTGREDG